MKLKSLILIFLSAFSLVHAGDFMQNDFEDQNLNENFFIELVSKFHDSIKSCAENKIYIKPGAIKSTHQGMILGQEDQILNLPILHSDHHGAYVFINDDVKPIDIIYCLCGWVKFEGDPCRNPDCPYK